VICPVDTRPVQANAHANADTRDAALVSTHTYTTTQAGGMRRVYLTTGDTWLVDTPNASTNRMVAEARHGAADTIDCRG